MVSNHNNGKTSDLFGRHISSYICDRVWLLDRASRFMCRRPSPVHRWGEEAWLGEVQVICPRGPVAPYGECWDPNPVLLLFVCLFFSISGVWVKDASTDSSLGSRPNPSSMNPNEEGTMWRLGFEALWSQTRRDDEVDFEVSLAWKEELSNGQICLCGLHSSGSAHTWYPLPQHSPRSAKSTFRLKIITTCEVSDVTSEWPSTLPIAQLDGFTVAHFKKRLEPTKSIANVLLIYSAALLETLENSIHFSHNQNIEICCQH